jgi:hypothetical protein
MYYLTVEGNHKKVYDKDAGMNVAMKFLRIELQDDYNHMMNHVD